MKEWAYEPSSVLYFFSVLFHQELGSKNDMVKILQREFDQLAIDSNLYMPEQNPLMNYYTKQMGLESSKLERFFCHTKTPALREEIVDIKIKAMELELKFQKNFRMLNVDPGYVAAEQVVLSSHKPYAHRLYIKDGVYVELEYIFKNNNWIDLPWTYPDYQDLDKKNYFLAIRKLLL